MLLSQQHFRARDWKAIRSKRSGSKLRHQAHLPDGNNPNAVQPRPVQYTLE
jgi:hypothetical protein